jgi:hypothetical protein
MTNISYSDLLAVDIADLLEKQGEVSCVLNEKQAKSLKSAWDAYENYANGFHNKRNKITILGMQIYWFVRRALLDLKYDKLFQLTNIYLTYARQLEPVRFDNHETNCVRVLFKLKG